MQRPADIAVPWLLLRLISWSLQKVLGASDPGGVHLRRCYYSALHLYKQACLNFTGSPSPWKVSLIEQPGWMFYKPCRKISPIVETQMILADLYLCCVGGCGDFKVTFEISYWRVIRRAVCLGRLLAISHSAQGHLLPAPSHGSYKDKWNEEQDTWCCFAESQTWFFSAPRSETVYRELRDSQKGEEMPLLPMPWGLLGIPAVGIQIGVWGASPSPRCWTGQAQCWQEWVTG